MKAILFCNTFGSLAVFREALIEELICRGYMVVGASPDKEGYKWGYGSKFKHRRIKIIRSSVNPFYYISSARKFISLTYEEKPTHIYSFGHVCNAISLLSSLFSRTKRVYVITGRGNVFYNKPTFFSGIISFLIIVLYQAAILTRGYIVVQNSEDFKFFTKKLFFHKQNKIVCAHGSAISKASQILLENELDKFSKEKKLSEKIRVTYISRIAKNKGLELFFDLVEETHHKYEFVLFGIKDESCYELLEKRFNKLVKSKKLFYGGYSDKIYRELLNTDVFVLLSPGEGCSHTMIQALAVGLPIITSNVPGNSDCVINCYNGFIVLDNSLSELIFYLDKIQSLDENDIRKYKENSIELYNRKFHRDKVLKSYIDLN